MAKGFQQIYTGIETVNDITVLYTDKGEYSTILKIENPIDNYCADVDAYYNFHEFYSSIIKTLGEGYAIQKQDIFCKQKFRKELTGEESFLTKSNFDFFEGREFTEITTYLIITQERKKTTFFQYDKKKWAEFHLKIQKICDVFASRKMKIEKLDEKKARDYILRYFCVHFKSGSFSLDNFKANDYGLKIGKKDVRCISLIDVDQVNLPSEIRPYKIEVMNNNEMPTDMMGFLSTVPYSDCIIYNQVIIIPSQRAENSKLTKKKNRHSSLPSPGNALAAADIGKVQEEIARNGVMLVYAHFNIIVTAEQELDQAVNYIESSLDKCSIITSKNAFNQMELFRCSFPGNCYKTNPEYDRFLTLHPAAICLFYKERTKGDENTPVKTYYTDRKGRPIAIDITGKEGKTKYTENSNFFSLGPSGTGKSFNMNSIVRQLYEQNTDIVLVDTGNSYEGVCEFFDGTYISYTDEKPITMNPFNITRKEYNIEKRDFLRNLIILLWKGSNGEVTQAESRLIRLVISEYYANYFSKDTTMDKQGIESHLKNLRQQLIEQMDCEANTQEEKTKIEQQISDERESLLKVQSSLPRVERLCFDSFFEFACKRLPEICKEKNISFNLEDFVFILEDFYKGGEFERILNNDMDKSLFNEQFIVFEIDAIKDNKILFPIVTLIIMDLFIQKMRIKENRKSLIIEEAWKALASPLMADYIKYLYKTVRKFWGIIGVVTQELDDIIGNDVVKDAIINNSSITILLDQAKMKDRYDIVANLLGLSDIERKKIFTINALDNKDGRGIFKEVYIRRGTYGEVYGVEESKECYMAYTTERAEKDGLKKYIRKYGNIELAIKMFCRDWTNSNLIAAMDFVNSKYFDAA